MSDYAPDTSELVGQLLALFDEAAEYRTEDTHPAPEVAVELARRGYPVFGMTVEEFTNQTFDLWERARVTEATIARFEPDAGERWAPERTSAAIECVRDAAMSDLQFLVARHLGQPAVAITTAA